MPSRLDQLMSMHEADPRDSFCLYAIAQEHAAAGRFEESLAWFDRLLEVEPLHAYGAYHKARALESLGRVGEAAECVRKGLESARAGGDGKAASELAAYLDLLE